MFLNNPKSFYWLIFCEVLIIVFCAWLFVVYLLGEVLVFSFLYIGCRYEPERIYTLLWGFQVQGLYLPFVILGFRLLSGQSILGELIGLALGELIFFVKEIVPEKYGYDLLSPPGWFVWLVEFAERKISGYVRVARPAREQPREAPRNNPFAGRGYRLG
jgi:Derlin-2/3